MTQPTLQRGDAVHAAIAACFLLIYGFYLAPSGIADSALYNTSVDVARWAARIGGFAFVVVAAATAAGIEAIRRIERAVAFAAGAIYTPIGAYWIVVDRDLTAFVVFAFGLSCLFQGRRGAPNASTEEEQVAPPALRPLPESAPPHPPPAPPPRDEPALPAAPPSDGYLAELGRRERDRRAHDAESKPS